MNAANRKEHRAKLREIRDKRKGNKCSDCKGSFPTHVLEFDHRDPSKKIADIGTLIKQSVPEPLFRKELKKCDVVCANCHKEREHRRSSERLV